MQVVPRDLLVDGYSLAYRAWFALSDAQMSNSSGQETQAVFGFVSMLARLLEDHSPSGMAVAFDRSGPTFRDGLCATYKAGRPETPESLITQIDLIRSLVQTLGVPAVDAEGYEADDVIATLAESLSGEGHEVFIVTGDRDAYQLVRDPLVRVLYNRRGVTDYVLYDEAGIEERTGVRPSAYPLLAALRGDPSDNLPGVPGVGEKTAAKLVNAYGDIDTLFAHLSDQTPRLAGALAEHEAQVRLNLQMTLLVRDVPVSCSVEEFRLGRSDRVGLRALLDRLEIRGPRDRVIRQLDRLEPKLASRDLLGADGTHDPAGLLEAGSEQNETLRPLEVLSFSSPEVAGHWVAELASSPGPLGVEPAWAGAPGRSALLGVAVARGDQAEMPSEDPTGPRASPASDGRAFEVGWLEGSWVFEPCVADPLGVLLALDQNGRPRILAHRAKELMRVLEPHQIRFLGLDLDTAVAAYLLDAREGQASLSGLTGADAATGTAKAGKGAQQLGFELGPQDDAAPGATSKIAQETAERVAMLCRLAPEIRNSLVSTGVLGLYEDVERPLVRVLAKMEVTGIAVDSRKLRSIGQELGARAGDLDAEIQELAGEQFNVNSTPQLRRVLFDKLGLSPQKRTKTGYSTGAQSLERLRGSHRIIDVLLRYREVEKLRSTYGESLLAEVASDGRIHATFNQTVARTGRLSSDQPNLHNIPVRGSLGLRFREAFVPESGCKLLVADYDQIELRVIAHLSDDPGLIEAFTLGRDIHNATASRVYGVDPKDVTLAMRSKAKMISYGLAYGMEAYGLSQRLGVGVEEASEILEQYFSAFPNVKQYMERSVAEARALSYTQTLLGRRRYLPDLDSGNFRLRQAAERQAMNAGIQGLAADIFKIALVRLDKALVERALSSRIVLQVHDEILIEVREAEREEVVPLAVQTMEHAFELKVPLAVHLAVGDSWAAGKAPASAAGEDEPMDSGELEA